MVRLTAVLGVLAAALAWAGLAGAATVSVSEPPPPGGPGEIWTMTYQADSGETNNPKVARAVIAGEPLSWIVFDGSAALTAGVGCTSLDLHTAICSIPEGVFEVHLRASLHLGDMNDSGSAEGACGTVIEPESFTCGAIIEGGGGDDWLFAPDVGLGDLSGGPGDDVLRGGRDRRFIDSDNQTWFDGGTGADQIEGFGGYYDTVSYQDRVNPVSVTLDGKRNDGEVGENDIVSAVRRIVTGSGDDVVVGNSSANGISTGTGSDVVRAGAGNDDVLAGPFLRSSCRVDPDGNDRIYGGSGNDDLGGCRGNDRIRGGPGRDSVNGGPGSDTVTGSSGRDFLMGKEGSDIVYARDGYADTVWGGAGHDRARIDRGLDRRSSIERLF